MKKIYYLSTCSTCNRIIKELGGLSDFEQQDIKYKAITPEHIDDMKQKAGSYEALFSRRSMKYRAWGLHEKNLGEDDFRELILKEYTFLKRPVIVIGDEIFIGNARATVAAAKEAVAV